MSRNKTVLAGLGGLALGLGIIRFLEDEKARNFVSGVVKTYVSPLIAGIALRNT